MKLFIPELGTKLKLTKSWKFNLVAEIRNLDLLRSPKKKLENVRKQAELKKRLVELKNLVNEDTKEHYDGVNPRFLNQSKYYGKYSEIEKEYWNTRNHNQIDNYKDKEQIIPKGTILEVDRIYIRKGARDFSSVTFKWQKDKKVIRF